MLTIDGEEASAVRSTSPLTITTGGTYHLGGKGHPNTITTQNNKNNTPLTSTSVHRHPITFLSSAHLGGKGCVRVQDVCYLYRGKNALRR